MICCVGPQSPPRQNLYRSLETVARRKVRDLLVGYNLLISSKPFRRLGHFIAPQLFASFLLLGCTTISEPSPASVVETSTDIASTLRADGRFNQFLTALDDAGLTELLETDGPFSIFVPFDDANASSTFSEAPRYIAPGALMIEDLHGVSGRLFTLTGDSLPFDGHAESGRPGLTIAGRAQVIQANIAATNGVIHVVDGRLLP